MKGVRSLELGRSGLLFAPSVMDEEDDGALRKRLAVPTDRRMWDLFRALGRGWSIEQIHEITKIDLWFLQQFAEIRDLQQSIVKAGLDGLDADSLRRLKRAGFGDAEIALARRKRSSRSTTGAEDRARLQARGYLRRRVRIVHAVSLQLVRAKLRVESNGRSKVVILGSGPNRIGQGIEFDYCCCHAAFDGGKPRDGDDQLQPGNRVDRLRHGRSVVLPAVDVRRRLAVIEGTFGWRRRVVPGAVRRTGRR
jgi:carbamoyl-phosphate synthase large subunit